MIKIFEKKKFKSSNELLTYLYIINKMKNGEAVFSYSDLSRACLYSNRTAIRVIKELINDGWIIKKNKCNKNAKNTYYLNNLKEVS